MICNKTFIQRTGVTSQLHWHASNKHGKVYRGAKAKNSEKQAVSDRAQPTISQFLKKPQVYPAKSSRKKALDQAIANMVVKDLMPLRCVEGQGFRDVISMLDNRYVLPSRKTLTCNLLPALFEKKKKEIYDKLSLAQSVSLTTDLWTSFTTSSFLALTAHFWDLKKESLEVATLDCYRFKGSHTGEAIAKELGSTMEEFKISNKTLAVTTDNGSNILKGVRLTRIAQISCFAHMLHLAVTDAWKSIDGVNELRNKVVGIVSHTKRSANAKDSLEECQRLI